MGGAFVWLATPGTTSKPLVKADILALHPIIKFFSLSVLVQCRSVDSSQWLLLGCLALHQLRAIGKYKRVMNTEKGIWPSHKSQF